MSLRVCAQPGCPQLVRAGVSKCKEHEVQSPTYQARNTSRAERDRRSATVAAWVETNGWVCPGWQRDPHPSYDLTAAHVIAAAHGGASGPLSVLCRSCNSRQGITPGG